MPAMSFYADIQELSENLPDTVDNPNHATTLQESLDAQPSTSGFQTDLNNKEALTRMPILFMFMYSANDSMFASSIFREFDGVWFPVRFGWHKFSQIGPIARYLVP